MLLADHRHLTSNGRLHYHNVELLLVGWDAAHTRMVGGHNQSLLLKFNQENNKEKKVTYRWCASAIIMPNLQPHTHTHTASYST